MNVCRTLLFHGRAGESRQYAPHSKHAILLIQELHGQVTVVTGVLLQVESMSPPVLDL